MFAAAAVWQRLARLHQSPCIRNRELRRGGVCGGLDVCSWHDPVDLTWPLELELELAPAVAALIVVDRHLPGGSSLVARMVDDLRRPPSWILIGTLREPYRDYCYARQGRRRDVEPCRYPSPWEGMRLGAADWLWPSEASARLVGEPFLAENRGLCWLARGVALVGFRNFLFH